MEITVKPAETKLFNANACHVCRTYGKDVRLKRCANCKMIAYCGREHQKEHWPQHKDVCRVISKLQQAGITDKKQSFWENTMEAWINARIRLTINIEKILGHELLPWERMMLIVPRCCEIYEETDFFKLHDCGECPDGTFCVKHPKDSRHSVRCESSKLCSEAFSMDVDLNFGNVLVAQNYGKSIPKNMDEAVSLFLPHCPANKTFTSPKVWSAFLSEALTRPYTFLYALEKLSRPIPIAMTIHVVDSGSNEKNNVHLWQNLFHHYSSLKMLKIVFVGSELENCLVGIQLCDECIKNKRKINVLSVGGSYANFKASRFFTKPDYVIGFQMGFDAWIPIISVLKKLDCPFFVSSFSDNDSKHDTKIINQYFREEVAFLWAGKNPFSSLKPFRNVDSNFIYENHYLTVYEKLSRKFFSSIKL